MPTGSAEREVERIVKLVRHAFFDIGNIQGIGFLYSSRKKIMVSENRAADITSFFFRSTVLASALDQRFHSTILSLDFLLRLQYSVISTALALAPTLVSSIRTPSGTPSLTMVQTPASRPTSILALNNATDDVLNLMDVAQFRKFSIDALPSTNTTSGVTPPSVNMLPSFTSFPSFFTPKMDRVQQSVASVGVTPYLGSLDFLDSQASFDYDLGPNLVTLRVSKRTAGTCATEDTEYLTIRLTKYCDLC